MAEITFRKAVPEDRARILEIYDHIFDAEEKGPVISGWRRGFYPTEAVADAGIESGEMVVMLLDGLVAGSARFNKVQDEVFSKAVWKHEASDEEVLVLHTLTADPYLSGNGLGTAFLAYYEKLAKEMGCNELRMDTGGTNSRARNIYRKAGFIEADTMEFSWPGRDPHKVIFLEKHLDT